jgi:hypothetical protein
MMNVAYTNTDETFLVMSVLCMCFVGKFLRRSKL